MGSTCSAPRGSPEAEVAVTEQLQATGSPILTAGG